MKKTLLVTILIISFFNNKVFAEDFVTKGLVTQGLDFREAILMALENNHEIRAMRKNLAASEKDIGITRSYLMPHVLFIEGFISTNQPALNITIKSNQKLFTPADLAKGAAGFNNPGNITNFLTAGVVFVPIFNKKTYVGLKMAKRQYSANGYTYLRKQEEIIRNVAKAYIDVGTAQEYIQTFIKELDHAKDHLKTAESHHKNDSSHSDVLQAKTKVFEEEQKLNFAQKRLTVKKKDLERIIVSQNPVEISTSTPPLEVRGIDYYKSYSICRNDIRAMEINVENSKNNIKLEQAEWYPNLNGLVAYNFWSPTIPFDFGAQGNDYVAGVFLTWSPFDGNKRVYEVSKAKLKSEEAKEYLAGLRDLVNYRVFEAYSNTEDLQTRFEFAQSAVKSAIEAELLITKKWENNLVPFVDILVAKSALDEARENLVKTSSDLKSQIIDLYYESGTIKEDLVCTYKNK